MKFSILFCLPVFCALICSSVFATAAESQKGFHPGLDAIMGMQGCYLVDYSFAEIASLKEGYVRDARIYDVNKDKSVKEWIYVDTVTPNRYRVQHILFMTNLAGQLVQGTELKHTGEDWEFNAPYLYDFVKPSTWEVKPLAEEGFWTRRITNLDDGLRYQCSAPWSQDKGYPEWSCSNYSPIPGRETRDMKRKDYNTLQRSTRVIQYGGSWLERQDNIKTIDKDGVRTPLARELGKTWYVRLPDAECQAAVTFVQPRKAFWGVVRDTWDEVFNSGYLEKKGFIEKTPTGAPPRFVKMMELEEKYQGQDMSLDSIKTSAKKDILKVIQDYRAN